MGNTAGGRVGSAIINNGGIDQINGGGTASGTTVNSGGFELDVGTASGTVVANGGIQAIPGGGSAIGTLVLSGGSQSVVGVASGTTVLSGGALITGDARIFGAVLSSGATAIIRLTTIASGTVLNGGTETVSGSPAKEQLALVNSGGLELVEASGTLASATISGGTVEIANGGRLSGTASFATSGGGTVQLDQAISYASAGAVISGFTLGDFIDFRAVGFTSGATSANWVQSGTSGTLTVSSGGVSADITLLGQYATANFKLSSDNHGGTLVGDPPVVAQTDLAPVTLVNPHQA